MQTTGIIYDERMCLHKEEGHPEQPNRIKHIFKTIQDENLLNKCKIFLAREATESEILTVHTNDHLGAMKLTPSINYIALDKIQGKYNSIYLNKHSYQCALLSAGGVVELCRYVVLGNLSNGIAIVRPPGHHAEANEAMGFCIFNNVAIAAKTMIEQYKLNRIVILDWDVHHGNATQHMFENDPRVLYISIHRYDNGQYYPCSKDAAPTCVGHGNGLGRNVNIAWNTNADSRIGDTEYIYAFEKLIKPMLKEYDPELIIVSAGFDCAAGDPLGGLNVSPAGFNHLTRSLMQFANGKVVIALEGGYNLNAISQSMTACLKALLKEPALPLQSNNSVSNVAVKATNETMKAHMPFWKFLEKN
jgi:histone deacetylase 6